jgi:pantoate--beta-alanine ligase
MKIIRTRREIIYWRDHRKKIRVGFVPTMGFLHQGHMDLVRAAKKENDFVVVSIFVNPTQFGPNEDFAAYPRDEKRDLEILRKEKVDLVFVPKSPEEIYPEGSDVLIRGRKNLTSILEGKFRPAHFDGVTTVVLKLFNLVAPSRAYFGEKDYQQLQLIRQMTSDLFLPIHIRAVRTKREKTGLAMSSRNSYLSEKDRERASKIFLILNQYKDLSLARRAIKKEGFELDYLEAWSSDLSKKEDERWLIAAWLKRVRLIDNVKK